MTGDDGDKVVRFPRKADPDYSVASTHDDASAWLFTYAARIREQPNEEAETLIALQKELERVDYIDGDWINGAIELVRGLLANHRCGDAHSA